MTDKAEAIRFFAERIANEAASQDHGHMPLKRDALEVDASWFHQGETLSLVLEADGQEREVSVELASDEREARREQITGVVEGALQELAG